MNTIVQLWSMDKMKEVKVTQIVLHLRTKHDANGNPRRLYLPLDPDARMGSVTHVIEEGYAGRSKLVLNGIINYVLLPIEVPISEYREWIRQGKEEGVYIP